MKTFWKISSIKVIHLGLALLDQRGMERMKVSKYKVIGLDD